MLNVETRALNPEEINPMFYSYTSHDEALANFLGRTFHDEPNFTYVLPEETARRNVLPLFFLEAIRLTRRRGQTDRTPGNDGAAVWMCPGQEFNFARMVRMGLLAMPFKMGNGFKRSLRLANSVDDVHHRLIREPHWYLMALAVEPTQQRSVMARALLEPGLLRADSDGLRCYLETFQETDLRFYEELGFRIAGAGCIAGGPNFWAMIRDHGGTGLATTF